MTLRKSWAAAAAAAMVTLSGAAQAALVDRGGGMIYDTTLNITWLSDMNYAYASHYTGDGVDSGGAMTWDAATIWANNLVYGGFSDWRLPTLNPFDTSCSKNFIPSGGGIQYYGFNCTGGELSHLFVTDLGNAPLTLVGNQTGDTAEQIANLAMFHHVNAYFYWSGTDFSPDPTDAWIFSPLDGSQTNGVKAFYDYALAVRPGDVAAASVPEPQTLALVLMGLGAALVARRKRPR